MKTALWIFSQYERAALTIDQVADLFGIKPKTIQNRVSAGTFPKPNEYGLWLIEPLAEEMERTGSVPRGRKAA